MLLLPLWKELKQTRQGAAYSTWRPGYHRPVQTRDDRTSYWLQKSSETVRDGRISWLHFSAPPIFPPASDFFTTSSETRLTWVTNLNSLWRENHLSIRVVSDLLLQMKFTSRATPLCTRNTSTFCAGLRNHVSMAIKGRISMNHSDVLYVVVHQTSAWNEIGLRLCKTYHSWLSDTHDRHPSCQQRYQHLWTQYVYLWISTLSCCMKRFAIQGIRKSSDCNSQIMFHWGSITPVFR